jgi:hypothetical protein
MMRKLDLGLKSLAWMNDTIRALCGEMCSIPRVMFCLCMVSEVWIGFPGMAMDSRCGYVDLLVCPVECDSR